MDTGSVQSVFFTNNKQQQQQQQEYHTNTGAFEFLFGISILFFSLLLTLTLLCVFFGVVRMADQPLRELQRILHRSAEILRTVSRLIDVKHFNRIII